MTTQTKASEFLVPFAELLDRVKRFEESTDFDEDMKRRLEAVLDSELWERTAKTIEGIGRDETGWREIAEFISSGNYSASWMSGGCINVLEEVSKLFMPQV